ncbi:hypothetical protein AB0O74_32710 [Streptomyces rubiginosohelvolus]|uniref:hypothetical protein n=1 Tax=Streptomyces rubiginosohelvolus TaxID=67362 RepID=UPI00342AB9BA
MARPDTESYAMHLTPHGESQAGSTTTADLRREQLAHEVARDVASLQTALGAFREQVLADASDDDRVRQVQYDIGVTLGTWVDKFACRVANTSASAEQINIDAREFVHSLGLDPTGFESKSSPELYETLRKEAGNLLARLWMTGFLLGPVPVDQWPNDLMAQNILEALECFADAITLEDDLRHFGFGVSNSSADPT